MMSMISTIVDAWFQHSLMIVSVSRLSRPRSVPPFTLTTMCLQGTMNGVVAMLGSLAGMIGPIVGSELFAWSVQPEVNLPYLSYWCLAAVCLAMLVLSLAMPAHLSEGPPAYPNVKNTDIYMWIENN